MPDTHTAREPSAAALEIQGFIKRSRAAQAQIENYTQEQVDELIRAIVWSVAQPGIAEKLAKHAVEETQLGNYDGKYMKLFRKTRAALLDIINDKSVGVIEEDKARNIIKIAKPIGVIGALSPSTNPEATPVIKSIAAIKGRNSIIIAPHPRAKITNKMVVDRMRSALKDYGAPEDLIIGIETPSLEKTDELMKQCDRVLATGGSPMVKAAYSSGTPALGVGVGNAVITVTDTVKDLKDTATKIRMSKTVDLAASCSADNSVILFDKVYDEMLANLQAEGGYLVSPEEKKKLQAAMFVDGHLNVAVVAQPPEKIAALAGIDLPAGKLFFIVPETGYGPEYPFSGEKLSVVLTLYRVKNIDEAVALTNNIQAYQGQGHSCGIYSTDESQIMKLAMGTKTSRVVVNQPQGLSNSGNLWNGMRQTLTLGCGSWGGNATNNNVGWRDLINETTVTRPLPESKVMPSDEQLFGDAVKRVKSIPVA
jgi:sulfoacetaldehyde dehydrogenase